jgi:1-acyl-sn-glycerol-3-phosphate acyltransferase
LIYRVKIDKAVNYNRFARGKKGFLIVSNHSSFLDIFVHSALFETAFVSKAEVKYYPVIGQIAWLMGVVFFDRRSPKERRRVLKTIANKYEGRNISVFPQGTTGRITERLPFQRGIFKVMELNHGLRLLPVTLHYKEDRTIAWHRPQTLKENATKVCQLKTIHLTVDIHKPVTIEDYRDKTTAEVCKMVEGIVLGPLRHGHQ